MAIKEPQITALDELRAQTIVDCDTMDLEVAKSLGPFVDCTSNQAIAYSELQKPEHKILIAESATLAEELVTTFPGVTTEQLAVEICMIKLQLRIAPHITGYVHVQTNPFNSYSTLNTVENAERIVALFAKIQPDFPKTRICIKIPSTWEGMMACKILEELGISTLATTLFSLEQGILAGEVGCTYIAPYVNELKVHFDPTYQDDSKLFELCLDIQRYYERHNLRTQVLPASLTSVEEIMMLAGVHHITIAPALLLQLSQLKELDDISIFGQPYSTQHLYSEPSGFLDSEAKFRLAFTQREKGGALAKLFQAIHIFRDMQLKLELLMKPNDG